MCSDHVAASGLSQVLLDDPPSVKRDRHAALRVIPQRSHLKPSPFAKDELVSVGGGLQIMRKNLVGILLVTVMGCLILPAVAFAQGGIAGVVTDSSGGVLPGVTVEAESPVLIERVRTVFTDSQGRYSIIDLRPGTYVVTFALPGFSTVRREGVSLPAAFTATVDASMAVGAVEQMI